MRLHDGPPLNIAPAVQLTWTAPTGANYAIEGAPTVQGPWLPAQNVILPGINQMTVPASDAMGFFRLVQAP